MSWFLLSLITICGFFMLWRVTERTAAPQMISIATARHGVERDIYPHRSRTLLVPLFFVLLAALCVTRSPNFSDTITYIWQYTNVRVNSLSDLFLRQGMFEVGFEFVFQLLRIVFGNAYQMFFLFFPVFNVGLIYLACRKRADCLQILALYLVNFSLFYNAIVLRQGMAITMCFLAMLVRKQSALKALLFILIGYCFHNTAIAMLVMLLPDLRWKGFTRKFYYISFGVVFLLYVTQAFKLLVVWLLPFLLESGISEQFIRYMEYINNMQNQIILVYPCFFFMVTLFVISRLRDIKAKSWELNIILLGFIAVALFPGEGVFLRMLHYFLLPLLTLMPCLPLRPNASAKRAIYLVMWTFAINEMWLVYYVQWFA